MSTTLDYNHSKELSILYIQREAFDPLRQPEVADDFKELKEALATFFITYDVNAVSPYASRDFAKVNELRNHLKNCACYSKNLYEQFPATLDGYQYLYKFQDFDKMIETHRRIDNGKYIKGKATEATDQLYDELKGKGWTLLKKYLNTYNPNSDMIWWTADDIENKDPYIARLKLGLTSSSIPERAVLMRLRLDDKTRRSLYIPNCVEAFTMPIFYAQKRNSQTGRTIDLENKEEGYSEIIGRHFDISQIEIHFCDINKIYSARKAPNAEAPRAYQITKEFFDTIIGNPK